MGEFTSELPEAYFDIAFSISVIEHVPDENLKDAFRDINRVLKPGGISAHAIDLYLFSDGYMDHPHWEQIERRVELYLSLGRQSGLRLAEPAKLRGRPKFDSSYATNSDLAMSMWNTVAPSLVELRKVAQACSLKAVWRKPD